jgi:hypothetical protein
VNVNDELYKKGRDEAIAWVIEKGEELCFCPECGAVMDCYSHFCDECRTRVGVPYDPQIFIEWLKKQK